MSQKHNKNQEKLSDCCIAVTAVGLFILMIWAGLRAIEREAAFYAERQAQFWSNNMNAPLYPPHIQHALDRDLIANQSFGIENPSIESPTIESIEDMTEHSCGILYGDYRYDIEFELVQVDDSYDHQFGRQTQYHTQARQLRIVEIIDMDGKQISLQRSEEIWLLEHVFEPAINELVYGW